MTEETQLNNADEAATENTKEGVTLGVADLNNAAQVIDIAVQRGAFRAGEVSQVGEVFTKLSNFVAQVQSQQEAAKAEENQETVETE